VAVPAKADDGGAVVVEEVDDEAPLVEVAPLVVEAPTTPLYDCPVTSSRL
jgi:hypothetical protein